MLDLTLKNMRTFEVKFKGLILKLEPPKVKTIKKMFKITPKLNGNEAAAEDIDELILLISDILSKNSKKIRIKPQEIEDAMDIDSMIVFLEQYVNWLGDIKSDPN